MQKPPWKAENARIKRKLAERKEPRKVVHEVVQVPARTVRIGASQYFDEYETDIIPEKIRKKAVYDSITRKIAEEMIHEDIVKLEVRKDFCVEEWRGSVMVVRY